ncbi:MAG TPA: sigma-54 dependent transcriptional regulator [Polyangiaceae bacterium]|nr:sigma-54 dependent transcriptional regulator [Polyangiaceae bacterium]
MKKPEPRDRTARVLVIDDRPDMAEMVADGLTEHGFEASALSDVAEATAKLSLGTHDALVTDLRIPGSDGLELLALSRAAAPDSPVIVMTAFSGIDTAVESIRRGAYHYLTKPFKVEELVLFLRRALDEAALRREAKALRTALASSRSELVGDSPAMRDVLDLVRRVADSQVPVLLLGETGTGKGLIARAIHAESGRASEPFVAVNCAAIPEALLESELFGHIKGAFTGASADRVGLFAQAQHGTLFLDEIAELSAPLQAKLLHVLETGHVRAVGSDRERRVDARVIAATHRDLRRRVADNSFREDLLYRLDVVSIEVPALRARRSDLPQLIEHFLPRALSRSTRSSPLHFSQPAMDALSSYLWPGNVRELEHLIERLVLLCRADEVRLSDLPKSITDRRAEVTEPRFGDRVMPIRELQRRYAAWALERLGGAKMATCEALCIDSKTLSKWLSSDNG